MDGQDDSVLLNLVYYLVSKQLLIFGNSKRSFLGFEQKCIWYKVDVIAEYSLKWIGSKVDGLENVRKVELESDILHSKVGGPVDVKMTGHF